ncbi:hypothetical protein EGI11_11825 [Chryseobacterium sp. H3056]|uniref:Uncharacterized protein n=1 Tax=Kaistella daneshvariae TaxID=2487074 RepID=A0A3N0WTL0_9FLAO|nr:hypothetical protein EGI11_11825 [Kaistella daneshvariae]
MITGLRCNLFFPPRSSSHKKKDFRCTRARSSGIYLFHWCTYRILKKSNQKAAKKFIPQKMITSEMMFEAKIQNYARKAAKKSDGSCQFTNGISKKFA